MAADADDVVVGAQAVTVDARAVAADARAMAADARAMAAGIGIVDAGAVAASVAASVAAVTAGVDAVAASADAVAADASAMAASVNDIVASAGAARVAASAAGVGADAARVAASAVSSEAVAGVAGISEVAGAAGAPRAFGASSSPAYKIALKQCPDCKRCWQFTGGRDIEVGPAVLELAACDAIHLGSLDATVPERATSTVTPRKREQVLARDGHCCTVPGCRRNVGLDLHHLEYQSHGGGHALSNLTTLCDLHHRAVHFEKLVIRGAAPERLTFEFRKPRDRRNVTDDDA
jgi:hypothetical protein